MAAVLSALLPGLGQFYNRQWAKGVGFLVGLLVLFTALARSADLEKLQQAAASGAQPANIGQLLLLSLLILVLAVWSIVDAARVAKQSQQ
ncbi:MAG: DUF5683 domain-containing protein [Nitrospiraceae bacterium]